MGISGTICARAPALFQIASAFFNGQPSCALGLRLRRFAAGGWLKSRSTSPQDHFSILPVVIPERWLDSYPAIVRPLEKDLPELLSFFHFPRHLWRKLRTTNVIEN